MAFAFFDRHYSSYVSNGRELSQSRKFIFRVFNNKSFRRFFFLYRVSSSQPASQPVVRFAEEEKLGKRDPRVRRRHRPSRPRARFLPERNPLWWRKECCSRSLDADGDGTHSREDPPNKNKGKIEKKNRMLTLSREGCFFLLKCRSKSNFLGRFRWVNVGESSYYLMEVYFEFASDISGLSKSCSE